MAHDLTHLVNLKQLKALGTKVKGSLDTLFGRTTGLEFHNAGSHNAIYRDKNLGTELTSAQCAAISAMTFENIYPGDYWTFSDVAYSYEDENGDTQSDTYSGTMRVMDLDYFMSCSDTRLTTHHVVVVPDAGMFTAAMNDTNTTEGGYVGSKMRTVHLKRAEAIFKACFGADHLLAHREYLVNAVADGKPSGGAWCDSLVELMDERMVYGSLIFDSGNPDGTHVPNRYSIDNSQLNVFRHAKYLISNRRYYWLRNVVSAAYFAYVNLNGHCGYNNASHACGVRPYALIY